MDTKTENHETPKKPEPSFLKRLPLAIVAGISIGYVAFLGINHFINPSTASLKTLNEKAVMLRMTGSFAELGSIDAETTVATIKAVCGNPNTKTVIFRMHSEGGSGTEAERIANTITKFCGKKETIALAETSCFSACYQVAVRADRIAINAFGHIGSVGTTMSWTDYSKQLAAQGVEERVIASGPKKSPKFGSVMLTPAQEEDLRKAVASSGKTFVDQVVKFRKGKLDPASRIEEGGFYASADALRLGLVDEIKTVDDIRDQFPGLKELGNSYSGFVKEEKTSKAESKLAEAMGRAEDAVR